MKELSIEEKAQRYDEALTKARNIVNSINVGLIGKDSFEAVFPELAESEDERIMKALIKLVKKAGEGYENVIDGVSIENAIAWLEKQGEQKHQYNSRPRYIGEEELLGEQNHTDKVEPKFKVGDKIRRKTPRRYDKDMQVTRIESNYYLCNHLGKFSSESISFSEESNYELVEQKPTDKVEPKFHKGEWIVFNGLTLYIGEDKNFYGTTTKDGINNSYDWDIDNVARPWTIKDAKDGDILYAKICDEEWLYLYNNLIDDPDFLGLLEKSWINNYCCYRLNDGWFSYEKQEAYPVNEYSIISPATKEQRDTLMKAMANAGYTFDFEKKELRKIEQNPAEWSEEDDDYINSILAVINGTSSLTPSEIECHKDWLKSLKDRVQHQNMWISVDKEVFIKEPILAQKKDKTAPFKGYVVCCDHTLDPLVFERYINIENISTQSLWRPSEEQMDALNDVISSRDIKYDVLSELWKDLNKLKD